MRLRRTAVLVGLVSLLSTACGTDPAPSADGGSGGAAGTGGSGGSAGSGGSGGTGGEAGTGGSGGSGGTGATGGTGGSEPRCGDGHVDPDEACDDGNEIDGDGCSSSCEWEGSCADPIVWEKIAVPHPDRPNRLQSRFFFHGMDVPASSRCGSGDGGKMVVRYTAPATGLLRHGLDVAAGGGARTARGFVRRTCDDAETEVWQACQPSLGRVKVDVTEGEVLFFVIDVPDANAATELLLDTELFPYRADGETCGRASGLSSEFQWQCAPGDTCADASTPDICTPNEQPVVTSARALRGGDSGDDLIVAVDASDPNADWWLLDMWFYDAAGGPLPVAPDQNTMVVDRNQLFSKLDNRAIYPATTELRFAVTAMGNSARFPGLARVDVRLRDLGSLVSNLVSAEIEPQPRVGEGEPCDPARARSLCESDDLVCRGPSESTSSCEARAPERAIACAAAPEVGVGTSLEIPWTEDEVHLPADWPLPFGCLSSNNGRLRRPELVFRLHLDEPRTNVALRTGDPTDFSFAALALFDGCGLRGAPLACNEFTLGAGRNGRIELPSLDAGDYLVVVSLPERPSGTVKLIVEADPLTDP